MQYMHVLLGKSLTKLGRFLDLLVVDTMKASIAPAFGSAAFVALVSQTVAALTTARASPYAGSASSDLFPPAGSKSSCIAVLACY
jgi:hypothetical protein